MTKTINRQALQALMENGNAPVLIEALPEKYYAQGHLPGARHLPRLLRQRDLPELAPGRGSVQRARLYRCRGLSRWQEGLGRGGADVRKITVNAKPESKKGRTRFARVAALPLSIRGSSGSRLKTD